MKGQDLDDMKNELIELMGAQYPNIIKDNLPRKTIAFLITFFINDVPYYIKSVISLIVEKIQETQTKVDENHDDNEEDSKPKKNKPKPVEIPEFNDEIYGNFNLNEDMKNSNGSLEDTQNSDYTILTQEPWTDEDVHLLIKYCKKFPGGISQRWDKIACLMGRSVGDVTKMAKNIKLGTVQMTDVQLQKKTEIQESTVSLKNNENDDKVTNWTQEQQEALEIALKKYPKGHKDRWDVITDNVPGKSKV